MASVVEAAKRLLKRHVGINVLFEARNKVLLWPLALRFRWIENREVRRLAKLLGRRPTAETAVVMPTYRRPELLQHAVASALAQTADVVVIVVDDGGGLPTLPDDPRLFAVSLSRNTHVLGLVRNVGIRLTDSQFIAFLDDDNVWYPHHVETAIAELEQQGHLVYTAVDRYDVRGELFDVLSEPFDRTTLKGAPGMLDANAIVVRRTKHTRFSRIPRYRNTFPAEDWEFVHRVSRRHAVRHIPVSTVRYLINPNSHYSPWDNSSDSDAIPAALREGTG